MLENEILKNSQKNMELEISEDKNYAWLTIFNNTEMIDENELIDFLSDTGVRFGFENAKAENAKNNTILKRDEKFLLAKGSAFPPKPQFELYFDPDEPQTVKQDNLLAKLLETDEPTLIGKDVFGQEIKSGDHTFDPKIYCGENCYLNEEMEILSSADGTPSLNQQKVISIRRETLLESVLDKDLTFETDLIVNGEINSSKLMINGNLTVYGDIVDCKKGIYATGNIKFFNGKRSKIFARGKIHFDNCDFCQMVANDEIIGSENSTVIGGNTISAYLIEISNLGNDKYEPTSAEISIAPYLKEQIKLLQLEIKKFDEKAEPKKFIELQQEQESLENNYLQAVIESLNDRSDKMINIRDKISKNCYLRIHNQSMDFDKRVNGHKFQIVP